MFTRQGCGRHSYRVDVLYPGDPFGTRGAASPKRRRGPLTLYFEPKGPRLSAHFSTGCPLPPSLSMGAASHATCSRAAAADNHGSEWNARPTRPPLSLAMTVCPARLLARSGPARLPAPAARARRSALGRCVCLHAVIKRRERASRARAPRRAESAGQLYGHDW